MCEPPIKEDMFAGFAGEMENIKTEGKLFGLSRMTPAEIVSFVSLIESCVVIAFI